MDKQFKYADKRKIRFAVIIGSKEMMDGACVIKNLEDGKQQTVLLPELSATLHQLKDVHK
jgi:histidyl-tRNA synthetase